MTLKEFLEGLNKFAKANPETLEMQVITSKDDEGNEFNTIYFAPIKGIFEDKDFISIDQYKDYGRYDNETNAVCVN